VLREDDAGLAVLAVEDAALRDALAGGGVSLGLGRSLVRLPLRLLLLLRLLFRWMRDRTRWCSKDTWAEPREEQSDSNVFSNPRRSRSISAISEKGMSIRCSSTALLVSPACLELELTKDEGHGSHLCGPLKRCMCSE